jgi:RNA polymerase sigma factor (sigma-70 family)
VNSFEFRQSFTGKRSLVAPQGAATNSARLGDDGSSFQKAVLPHLDDAYGLARWLVDDRTESENVVHGACLSAFRGFGEHSYFNARVWVLGIVHRAAYEWLGKNRTTALAAVEDSEVAEYARHGEVDDEAPESALLGTSATQLEAAIAALPAPIRETIVLRDILGLSYRDIAEVTGTPTSSVVTRLAEARHTVLINMTRIAPASGGSRQTSYHQQSNVIV